MALGDELANLNFEQMIGGPLIAVIKAQAQSSITSVDFIKSVGFSKDADGKESPTMVSFTYDKPFETTDEAGKTTIATKPYKLTVPLLTMLPVPFIRIEETTIDFNAKINSVEESQSTRSTELGAGLKVKGGWGPVSAELNVNFAYKSSTSNSVKVERTYTMAVHVRAAQADLPEGTVRLLSILERNISEAPATDKALPG
ncbi:hypothetical protein DRW03_32180 [Corallococcus sp. H22C18031201]|nr:hypothetical protein DRW03_32180 [Corallococcus sp. H22C18031201]